MALEGRPELGVSCFGSDGQLSAATIQVLEEVKRYDLVLATVHISNEETMAVVEQATELGIRRIVVTHPVTANRGGTPTMDIMKHYVERGCYIEHAFIGLTGVSQVIAPDALAACIREIGPQRSLRFARVH